MTWENPHKPFQTGKAKLTFLIARKAAELVLNINLDMALTKQKNLSSTMKNCNTSFCIGSNIGPQGGYS